MMVKRGLFVCFIGIDGSGKTTVARQIVNFLNSQGIEARYAYSAIFPVLLRPFMVFGKKVFLRGTSKSGNYRAYLRKKRGFLSQRRAFAIFWQTMVWIDAMLQLHWKVTIPILRGKNIISDRYLYDTLLNVGLGSGATYSKILANIRFFLRFFPCPDVVFFIDVPETISMSRKDDVPDIEYLKKRREIYKKLSEDLNMTILDGTKPILELREHTVEQIRRMIRLKGTAFRFRPNPYGK